MADSACDCDKGKYETAFSALLNGSLPEARAAKKELDRMYRACRAHPRCLKQHVDAIERSIVAIPRTTDPKRVAVLLSSLNNMVFFFDAPAARVDAVGEAILTNIVHERGDVRDAARRLAGTWRLHAPMYRGTGAFAPSPSLLRMLERVRDLLKMHRPTDTDVYLDTLSPSVFKSLGLLWETITRGVAMDEWIMRHPEFQSLVPLRTYEDEEWLDDHPVDRREVLFHLWNTGAPTVKTEKIFHDLEMLACDRFCTTLAWFGFTDTEQARQLDGVKHARTDETQMRLVAQLVKLCLHKGHRFETLGAVARELQAVINHTVRRDPHLYSDFLLSAATEREMADKREPRDFSDFLLRTLAVHRAIDTFVTTFLQERECELNEFLKRLASLPVRKNAEKAEPDGVADTLRAHHARTVAEMDECRSIAHHVWDWYAQVAPWHTPKTPEKYAALAYLVVRDINREHRQIYTPYDHRDLAAFGGWKGESSVHGAGYTIINEIWERIIDKDLLFLLETHPETEDDDDMEGDGLWEEGAFVESPVGTVRPGFPRYYVVVSTEQELSGAFRQRLETAVRTIEKEGTCVLEHIEYGDQYALVSIGVSLDTVLQSVVDDVILSANGLEPFLRFHFLATNTHKPNHNEILKYLKEIT